MDYRGAHVFKQMVRESSGGNSRASSRKSTGKRTRESDANFGNTYNGMLRIIVRVVISPLKIVLEIIQCVAANGALISHGLV